MTSTASPAGRRIDRRHPLPVRIWHWANALAILVLIATGFLIFDIHPSLYWGDDGHAGLPALASLTSPDLEQPHPSVELQIGAWRRDVTGLIGTVVDEGDSGKYLLIAVPPDDWEFGATRGWHFLAAWIVGLSVPLYLVYLVASRRLARRLLPTRTELALRSVAGELWQHLRLRRARGEAAGRYNVLQKVAYLGVLIVLLPVTVLSGLTMSHAITAEFPGLFVLFDGRQSARTIHFCAATLMTLFLATHVFQVCVAGFVNLMRSMITGRFVVDTTPPP
jgi:thiosulfate reductase cytochrome b subunit